MCRAVVITIEIEECLKKSPIDTNLRSNGAVPYLLKHRYRRNNSNKLEDSRSSQRASIGGSLGSVLDIVILLFEHLVAREQPLTTSFARIRIL